VNGRLATVEETKYTVTFNSDGGTLIDSQKVIKGEKATEPTIPIKEGYTFVGWFMGEEKWSFIGYSVTEDITLVAKWIEDIDFNIEGATLESNVYHLSVDNNVTSINFNQIVQSNQIWYLSKDINGTSINITKVGLLEIGNNTFYIIEEDGNDYNTYEINIRRLPIYTIYTVTFITNSDAILESIEIQEGSLIGTIPTITKEGYIFDGWYKDSSLSLASYYELGSTMPAENLTLYAKWAQMYEYFTIDNMTYVYYGTYPQTVVDDSSLISSLNSLTSTNANGYYEFEGEEYAKVVAHPYETGYKFINGSTIQSHQTYYFKVEPIKWRVLEEVDGTYTLLSEYIIDKQVFYTSEGNRTIGDQTIYANNYEHSTIREWLNNAFYNKAFSSPEKGSILTTLVDNSASTTAYSTNPYFSNNTMDKVYLLSYQEAISSTYGFSAYPLSSSTRTAVTTDYARAVGAYMNTSTNYYGNGDWWLRSPYDINPYSARNADNDGYYYIVLVDNSYNGARPAIKIG